MRPFLCVFRYVLLCSTPICWPVVARSLTARHDPVSAAAALSELQRRPGAGAGAAAGPLPRVLPPAAAVTATAVTTAAATARLLTTGNCWYDGRNAPLTNATFFCSYPVERLDKRRMPPGPWTYFDKAIAELYSELLTKTKNDLQSKRFPDVLTSRRQFVHFDSVIAKARYSCQLCTNNALRVFSLPTGRVRRRTTNPHRRRLPPRPPPSTTRTGTRPTPVQYSTSPSAAVAPALHTAPHAAADARGRYCMPARAVPAAGGRWGRLARTVDGQSRLAMGVDGRDRLAEL